MARRTRLTLFLAIVGVLVPVNVGVASIASATTFRASGAQHSQLAADTVPVDASAGQAFVNLSDLRADHLRTNARDAQSVAASVPSAVQLRIVRIVAPASGLAPSAQPRRAVQSRAPPQDRS